MDSRNRRRRRGPALAVTAAIGLIATGLVSTGPVTTAAATGGPVIRIDQGLVRGKVTNGVREFQGIPYAAPPVGEYRRGSPRPALAWAGVHDATNPGDSCAQNEGIFGEPASVSEDCLFVNVTSPQRAVPRVD